MVDSFQLTSMKTDVRNLKRRIDDFPEVAVPREAISNDEEDRLFEIEDDYNELRSDFNSLVRDQGLHKRVKLARINSDLKDQVNISPSEKTRLLQKIEGQLNKSENILEELESVSFEEEEEEELKQVSKEIEQELETDFPVLSSELYKSLDELRDGHLLASSLICGRIMDYALDKIGAAMKTDSVSDQLEHLASEDIIYESTEGKITDAIKQYRNMYAHEPGKHPDISDSLIILMGTTKFLKNIKESGKAEEFELK